MKEDKENDLKTWQFAEIIRVKLVNFLKIVLVTILSIFICIFRFILKFGKIPKNYFFETGISQFRF